MTSIGSGQVIDYSDNYWENLRQRTDNVIDTILDTSSRGVQEVLTNRIAQQVIPVVTNGTNNCLKKINCCGESVNPCIDACTTVTGTQVGRLVGEQSRPIVDACFNRVLKPGVKKVKDWSLDSTKGCVDNFRTYFNRSHQVQ